MESHNRGIATESFRYMAGYVNFFEDFRVTIYVFSQVPLSYASGATSDISFQIWHFP
jgi:hypothetical protein